MERIRSASPSDEADHDRQDDNHGKEQINVASTRRTQPMIAMLLASVAVSDRELHGPAD